MNVADIYSGIKNADPVAMGFMASHMMRGDPKHIAFTAARYKFVAKMLEGKRNVLEVGCGDGFFSAIVAQHVTRLVPTDKDAAGQRRHDMLKSPFPGHFDAAYALDVLEHVTDEDTFLRNMKACTVGPVIIGMPSLESQAYASELSREGHVNCKTREGLRETMQRHFREVFIFSMNDEVIHTGQMACYFMAIGV